MPRFCSECGAPLPAPPPVTCRACDTSHWLDAKPCAGALVSRAGELLLVRRAHEPWKGAWDVPSGFCGPREHPREAAAREVREETGLDVEVGGVLGMWIDSYAPDGPGADKVTLNIYFHALAPVAGADPQRSQRGRGDRLVRRGRAAGSARLPGSPAGGPACVACEPGAARARATEPGRGVRCAAPPRFAPQK